MNRDPAKADVWVVEPTNLHPEVAAQCLEVLSLEERCRMLDFHFEQDRSAFLAAHALKRFALTSRHPEIPPQAWSFDVSQYGRPEIASAVGVPRWRFNLSHARNLVACVITLDIDCGVDVEQVRHPFDWTDANPMVLTSSELAQLALASDEERPWLFCRFWTLKEAYAKAHGLGLHLPFHQISFELGNGAPQICPYSGEWQFEQWAPNPSHFLATAIRASSPVHVTRHCGIPGVE